MSKSLHIIAAMTAGSVGAMLVPAFPPVDLQDTTPGVAQTGHLNISGTAIAGTVRGGHVFGNSTLASGVVSGGDFRSVSVSGRGVTGLANGPAGTTTGGYFQSASTAGRGVYGGSTATSGTTFGGRFDVSSPGGRGVYAVATATTGFTSGVYGQSNSSNGYGLYGYVPSSTGTTFGVYGYTASNNGYGVYGNAAGSGGYAGRFYAPSGQGVSATGLGNGVVAYANTALLGYGVLGIKNNSSSTSGYGVYGSHVGGGFAVFAGGSLGASGTKSFRIDHPTDPENKFLYHYSVEGPEVLNVYTGNIRTDAKGFATVRLPDYFAEVNKDPRYSLTVVDESDDFVMAKVSRRIQNNQFVIRTSKPNVSVSWEVKGVRNDRYVQRYGAPVVADKPEDEVGRFANPELYGKGREFAIEGETVERDKAADERTSAAPQK